MKKILTFLFVSSVSVFGLTAQNVLAEHHFESGDINEVTVIGSFCDVYVTIGSKTIFDGVITGKGQKGDYLIASIKSGDQVVFKVEQKENRSSWRGNDLEKARIDLTISDGTTLDIDNTSGDVVIFGPASSAYSIKTTSGDVELSDLTGSLSLRSTSGDLEVKQVNGNVVMRSTSGDHEIEGITGELEAKSTSGDIEIRGMRGELVAGSTSGDIEVNDAEGTVSFNTTSGNIEGMRINLTSNSDARSTSGDIRLRFTTDLEDIGFDLNATSGDLEVGNIDAEDRLILKRGGVTFRGNSTSGDQVYSN